MANIFFFILAVILGPIGRRKGRAELTSEGKELLDAHTYLDARGVPITKSGYILTVRDRMSMLVSCGSYVDEQQTRYYCDN
jgi:hypothetical protein